MVEQNRRGDDAAMKSLQDSMDRLSTRVDDIFSKLGKIDSLNEKVGGFVALMEKIDERANDKIESMEKRSTDHETRIRLLEQNAKLREGSDGVKGKALEIFLRSYAPYILGAAFAMYITFKEASKPNYIPAVTINSSEGSTISPSRK